MAELDLDIQIDHRSFKTLGIELEPQHKIGAVSYDIDRESERYSATIWVRRARQSG
jgi:hypothetical protein